MCQQWYTTRPYPCKRPSQSAHAACSPGTQCAVRKRGIHITLVACRRDRYPATAMPAAIERRHPVNQAPYNRQQMPLRLHRSVKNRMIAGVCGGLAETFGLDPLLVRVVTLALLIPFNVFTVLVYAALALILPVED